MSFKKPRWGVAVPVSGPHGDLAATVKGRGSECTSVDLNSLSLMHKYSYISASIVFHCSISVFVENLGVGKSLSGRDHFRIPVAKVF